MDGGTQRFTFNTAVFMDLKASFSIKAGGAALTHIRQCFNTALYIRLLSRVDPVAVVDPEG